MESSAGPDPPSQHWPQKPRGKHREERQGAGGNRCAETWGWDADKEQVYDNAVNHVKNGLNLLNLSHKVPVTEGKVVPET